MVLQSRFMEELEHDFLAARNSGLTRETAVWLSEHFSMLVESLGMADPRSGFLVGNVFPAGDEAIYFGATPIEADLIQQIWEEDHDIGNLPRLPLMVRESNT